MNREQRSENKRLEDKFINGRDRHGDYYCSGYDALLEDRFTILHQEDVGNFLRYLIFIVEDNSGRLGCLVQESFDCADGCCDNSDEFQWAIAQTEWYGSTDALVVLAEKIYRKIFWGTPVELSRYLEVPPGWEPYLVNLKTREFLANLKTKM